LTRRMKEINAKKAKRTDADFDELADLEVESRLYWNDALGVYVPTRWVAEAIARKSFAVMKMGKQSVRGALFLRDSEVPLEYRGKKGVKTIADVVKNPAFRHAMILPQGVVRVEKNSPIFHDWSFSTTLDFDDKVFDARDLKRVLEETAQYVGFGDFRPTFGRARAEVEE